MAETLWEDRLVPVDGGAWRHCRRNRVFLREWSQQEADANAFLNKIKDNPAMDERYRYVSHGFVKKNKLATLDAADLLGWEWTQQARRLAGVEKRPPWNP